MTANESVFEVMATARSMRWLREDPVDPQLVERVIWAGTRASSPNNAQAWDFVVVTSPAVKRSVQEAIRTARIAASAARTSGGERQFPADPVERRTALGSQNLVDTMHSVPVLIFVCGANNYPAEGPVLEWAYSAIYAAAQNMLVAARALGLGAAFTTLHRQAEVEIREILRIPGDRILGVTMPLGWPARPFGRVDRRPVPDVMHAEGW